MSVLIKPETFDRIVSGAVTLAFRRWRKPMVRAGGTLRTAAGVLAIEAVDVVDPAGITAEEARLAGFADRAELAGELARWPGETYRIRLRYVGADPRVVLRESTGEADVAESVAALRRMDARRPWTRAVLELIEGNPGVRAVDLAERLGRPRDPFKTDVRKLKDRGLTESLEVGYRLSPRGQAVLDALRHAD